MKNNTRITLNEWKRMEKNPYVNCKRFILNDTQIHTQLYCCLGPHGL